MFKKFSKKNLITIAIIILISIMFITIFSLKKYVKKNVHNERVNYLTQQTNSTSLLVDNIITQFLDYTRVSSNYISNNNPGDTDIYEYINNLNTTLSINNAKLLLVDSNAIWYGKNNTNGKIINSEYYTLSTPDEYIYITETAFTNNDALCYRVRLSNPVHFYSEDNNDIEISYCCIVYDLDNLSTDLKRTFPYNCNGFILDDTGLMIYKSFEMGILISGSNFYNKLDRVEILYGDTAENILSQINYNQTVVAEILISDENYFICSAPLSINNWSIAFIVDSEQLSSGNYLNSIFSVMILLGIILALSTIIAGVLLLKNWSDKLILEKNQLENEYLEKTSNAKSVFISNMTHDIRTPINGIMGMTALAKEETDKEKANEYLNKIDISSKYLLSLVNDVLDMSALEDNSFKLNLSTNNLYTLLFDCMVIANSKAIGRNLNIISEFNIDKDSYVLVDELRLKQVFINILSNAIKFTPENGNIWFKADKINDKYVFSIKDTGIGMESDFIDHIWDRFSQSNSGARSEYKGTGLGMAITKNIIDSMNGDISVESKLHEGTCFTIVVKLDETNKPNVTSNEINNNNNILSNLNILIAEDNEINMEIAIEMLSNKGAVVTPAYDGEEALELYLKNENEHFDLILLDLMMPKLNGIETAKAIRSSKKFDAKFIPIIAMTANTDQKSIENTMAVGMNGFISKPFDINVLINKIKSLTK